MTNKLNVNYAGHLIEAEQIVVPASSPYKVRTVHNKIKKETPSVVEIWQNSDKTGTQLVEEEYTGTVSATGKFQVDYEGVNDGDIRYCNTIVFHSGQAGQTFYIWYKTMGDIVDANDFNAKADKVVGGTENNLVALDTTGNLKDAQKKVSDFEPIITPKGTAFNKDFGTTADTVCEGNDSRLSNPRTPTAHSSTHITGGTDIIPNAVPGGNSGLLSGADKQNLDDAAAKKHTQGTDTTLGNMTADINMNSHKVTNLSAPTAANDAIRQTTKVTETNLEDAVDKKHSQNTDTGTNSTTFQIGTSGPKLKNASGIVEVRNAADSTYGDIRPNNVYPLGSTTPLFTTTDATYYVNDSTGNDNNDGSSGSPFKTIAKAISLIPQIVNHIVTINVADGSYSGGIDLSGKVGCGLIRIVGNETTPDNVILSGQIYISRNTCQVYIVGFKTTYTNGHSVLAFQNPGYTQLNKIVSINASDYAGFSAEASTAARIQNSTFSNKAQGIVATLCSRVLSETNTGTGNVVGLRATASTLMKTGSQPGGTTAESALWGGVIR